MKSNANVVGLICSALGGVLLLPVANLIVSAFGWSIRLTHPSLYKGIIACAELYVSIKLLKMRKYLSGIQKKCLSVIAPMVMIISFISLLPGMNDYIAWTSIVVIQFSCILILHAGRQKHVFNILCNVLAIPLIVIISVFLSVGFFMVDFGYSEVVREIVSPDEKHIIEVVNIDQGALGGDTAVYVVKNPTLFVPFGHLFTLENLIYRGEWNTWDDLKIEWIDRNTAIVNGVEHRIE